MFKQRPFQNLAAPKPPLVLLQQHMQSILNHITNDGNNDALPDIISKNSSFIFHNSRLQIIELN